MSENLNYKNNLRSFVKALQGSFIEKLVFDEDLEPMFDKDTLPFAFKYCFSTVFVTNKGNFLLHTSLTSFGHETFWVDSIESIEKATSEKLINSEVKAVSSKNKYDGFSYKLSIELENGKLIIYAAEIYDGAAKKYTIKVNDEMIFVFDDDFEAKNSKHPKTTPDIGSLALLPEEYVLSFISLLRRLSLKSNLFA